MVLDIRTTCKYDTLLHSKELSPEKFQFGDSELYRLSGTIKRAHNKSANAKDV